MTFIRPEYENDANLDLHEATLMSIVSTYHEAGGCYASNQHLANKIKTPVRTFYRIKERLVRSRYLAQIGENLVPLVTAKIAANPANMAAEPQEIVTAKMAEKTATVAEPTAKMAEDDCQNGTHKRRDTKAEEKKKKNARVAAPVAENWMRLGRRFAETRKAQTGSDFNQQTVTAFGRLLADIAESEPATEAEIEAVINWLASPAGRQSWEFNIGKTSTSYNHPFKRNFNMYRARSNSTANRTPQQSALPLNAPSTVDPSAPTSTLPAGLTKSAGDLAWWAGCLGKIADGMDPDFFREYIGCLEIAGIDGEWLHLEAPTAYIKGNAVWHCDAIEEATGKQVKIHVRDWSQD